MPEDGASDSGTVPDAGNPCDRDRDGFEAMSCGGTDCDDANALRFPGAPPVCGNGQAESCPGDTPPGPSDLLGAREVRGQLAPLSILADSEGYRPRIALAAGEVGSHGRALVFALERQGDGTARPRRFDVPLDAYRSGALGPLRDGGGGDLTLASATSIGAASERQRVGVHIVDRENEREWFGALDVVTESGQLVRRDVTRLDDAAVLSLDRTLAVIQRSGGSPVRLDAQPFDISAPTLIAMPTTTNVPTSPQVRTIAGHAEAVMLQDGAGDYYFWNLQDDVWRWRLRGATGKAAFVQQAGATHDYWLASHGSGTITFHPVFCDPDNPSFAESCGSAIVSPPETMSTRSPGGEVPDARELFAGRVGFLVVERFTEGDVLVLQPMDSSGAITVPRIEVLDLRASGERIVDAKVDKVTGTTASTIAVAVAVGTSESGNASRVVFTGFRGCDED
jgi:hypothetical protein